MLALPLCAATPPDVGDLTFDSGDTALAGSTVGISVPATSPDNLALTFLWDFGDGTPNVTTTTNSTNHVFAAEGDYLVDVAVSDGVNPVERAGSAITIVPVPDPSAPIGADASIVQVNPDINLSITVALDQDGVVQFNIDDSQLSRSANTIETDFGDTPLGGRTTATGSRPLHSYSQPGNNPGIFTATTKVTDTASSSELGRSRKSLVMGNADMGLPPVVTAAPVSNEINVTKLKGKVNLNSATKKDSVSFTWTIELAEGLDISVPQDIALSIGNITETVTLTKGRGKGVTYFKNVSVKYPKLPKGQTLTTAGLTATVTAQVSAIGLSAAGMDTDGVTARKKVGTPKLQVLMLIGGIGYSSQAEITIKPSVKGDNVLIGRAAVP
jgi:hypothetical protein